MEDKAITHYLSSHKILLVGEGDFSFSLCLARAFGTGVNMVATSLDSRAFLEENYGSAIRNLTELEDLGCTLVHGIDVHKMTEHPRLLYKKFDRIIYNFPHAGFVFRESEPYQIQLHQKLVSGFFKNAKCMLHYDGEIHVTHKTKHPYYLWDIKMLAKGEMLDLAREEEFYPHIYPGYTNKRGSGYSCDQSFIVGACSTFMFKHS